MIHCIFENGRKGSLRHVTVDGLIIDKGKILLVKRPPHLSNPNKYAAPGGFLDRDEDTKEGVVREVLEETGYKVEIISLFKIVDKPDRANEDRQNVNFTFIVKPIKKIKDSDEEVAQTLWFDLDNLPKEEEFAFDHFETLSLYLKHLKTPFSLPIVGESS